MSFVYTTAIKKLRQLSKRKKVVQGGTSAGKTFGILPILIDRCCRESALEISIVSESIPHLRRGAMKDFLKIMQMTNRFISKNWNKSHLRYTFENGSYIEFFSADQDDKLRGARRTDLYVNEANNISFEAYHQMAVRTSGTIWIDFNPVNEFWAHTEVLKENDSEQLILTYKDNEALSDTIVKEIEKAKEKAKTSNYWENWWNVYGLGKIGRLEGVVFDNWHTIDKIPEEAKLIGAGLDFGYSNDPTALIAIYKMDNKLYHDEVIYQKGLSNVDIAKLIKSEIGNVEVYADSAEPKSIKEIRYNGVNITATDKGRDSINYGIQLMQQEPFYVTKRSINYINELRKYMWKQDKEGNFTGNPIDIYNHGIDAVRYFYMMQNKNKADYTFKSV